MEIILKENMPSLGEKNDIVTVKDGYGRNYLIPKGIAIQATPSALKIHAENTRQRAHKEEKIKKEAESVAAKMEGISLTLGAKTSSTGKIFGSVNNIQLAEALAKQGFKIDRKQIIIEDEQIKNIGKYKAVVKLHREVKVDIEFEVVTE